MMVAIDSSKQESVDADPKPIQQINFIGNLNEERNATMLFIIEETNKPKLDFSQETIRVL